jgi:LPS-assembly protein
MNKIYLCLITFISFSLVAKQITNDIYVNSSNIYYDKEKNIVNLGENSLINYQTATIKTDEGIIDVNNKKITIDGNFYLNYSNDIMKGESLKADLNFNEGSAINVNYIFDKELKINSKYLYKKNNNITFLDSFFTRCDLNGYFSCPTWSLKVNKTKYKIEEDFYEHFSTFVQIADKKVFYMPYFSHYGTKAKRQRGFLTPSAELINKNFGGNITLPYYIPVNDQTDIQITPTLYYEQSLTRYFKNRFIFQRKISEGDINLTLDNFYDRRINGQIKKGYTIGGDANLNLNKKNNLNVNLNYTSNISKHKSSSDSKDTTMTSDIKLNTYNFINKNDMLSSRISGSKDLDSETNTSNPYELPSLEYLNYYNFKNNAILNNKVKLDLISRNTSANYLPMRIFRLNVSNSFQKNYNLKKNYKIINTLKLSNTILSVKEGSRDTNIISGRSERSSSYISSEINKIFYLKKRNKIKPRLKFIFSNITNSKELNINDNSQSLSFSYNNIYQENKYFGSDKEENGSRVVMGLEQKYYKGDNTEIAINYGSIYNIDKERNYMLDIKQGNKLSDHLMELSLAYKSNKFSYNSRNDYKNFDLKEDSVNYSFENGKNNLALSKNLTNKNAYKDSESSHFMTLKYNRSINGNSNFSYENEIDFENKYEMYSQKYELNFYDECSTLSIAYKTENYSDGNELKPNKTLSIKYEIDF